MEVGAKEPRSERGKETSRREKGEKEEGNRAKGTGMRMKERRYIQGRPGWEEGREQCMVEKRE